MTGPARWPGYVAAAIVLGLCVGTLVPLVLRSEGFALSSQDIAVIRFTLIQAFGSALLSCLVAIPVARALARRRFAGRSLLILLLGAPFIMPVIVAVLGLLAIFGRAGLFNSLTGLVGVPPISIYGLSGVLLAHVFLNMPLATRLLLIGWQSVPAEHVRLAASLNVPPALVIERPLLRRVLPGSFITIFLLCLTSFATVLILGGGPRATSIELAIYQSLRFDFDPGRAALLSLVQFGLCAGVALLATTMTPPPAPLAGLDRPVLLSRTGVLARLTDTVVLAVAGAFLVLPIAAVVIRGAASITSLSSEIWIAAGRSFVMALASTGLCLVLSLALASAPGRLATIAGAVPLATSSLAMGTGLFLILYPFAAPSGFALPVTIVVNAVMALPFALRAIAPAVGQIEASYGRLASSLRLHGSARLRILVLPRLRRPLGFAAGLTAALSMGDLGVIALFADHDAPTLPLAMQRLMAAYRMDAAAGTALLLLGLSLALFYILDRGLRRDADA